jgi:MFS transporter, SP family, general alpha glucoside:H+ symporter
VRSGRLQVITDQVSDPGWCANHGRHEQGQAIVRRLNGKISGYDVDFHYGIIRKTVEREERYARELHGEKKSFWQDIIATKEIFMGVNGVSSSPSF